ncbi:MAG: hypothetical protein ACYTAS_11355 [Planctomycetota bacterium]|jgi:hypothetical protein
MRKHIIQSVLLACLWAASAPSVLGETGGEGKTRDPRFVLEQIQKRLDTISNYQCTQITTHIRWNRRDPNQVATNIDKRYIAYDRQGRRRIRELSDNLGATSYIWDGTQSIEVREQVKRSGTVIHSASIFPGKCRQAIGSHRPWTYLGGFLAEVLTKALENGKKIGVEATEDGYCRLEVHSEDGTIVVAVLDPARGYLPMFQAIHPPGAMGRWNEIESREIDPGVWFPIAVRMRSPQRQTSPSQQAVPRFRYTDVKINDPDFDRLLAPDLPTGSTVADMVRGVRRVVDRKRALNMPGSGSSSAHAGEAIETVYSLGANEALKRIALPFPPARGEFILKHEPDLAPASEAAFENTVYVLQWDDDDKPTARYAGMGFLNLSEILQVVCDLDIFEYSGPENVLDLRLTGDWIVRRGASREARLRLLERIVYEETSMRISFEKRRVDTPVVRATGIFRYQQLPGALGENDVQMFAEASSDQSRTYTGGGLGSLAQFLRHMANRTGRPFVDDTLSSDVEVSWSDYGSSKMAPYDGPRQLYRRDLARLLDNVAKQTGLTFTTARRRIDEWRVRIDTG